MARKLFVRRDGRTAKRQTFWLGGTFVRTTLGGASTGVIMTSLSAAALALRPFTIIRTRGIAEFHSDQVAAAENMEAVVAHAVVSDQAFAVGITAVPTPSTDSDSDLFYQFDPWASRMELITAAGFNYSPQIVIDSKAMRRVDQGEQPLQIIETGVGSSGVIVTTFFRTLIKLH